MQASGFVVFRKDVLQISVHLLFGRDVCIAARTYHSDTWTPADMCVHYAPPLLPTYIRWYNAIDLLVGGWLEGDWLNGSSNAQNSLTPDGGSSVRHLLKPFVQPKKLWLSSPPPYSSPSILLHYYC